jgi:hypothetical protein
MLTHGVFSYVHLTERVGHETAYQKETILPIDWVV